LTSSCGVTAECTTGSQDSSLSPVRQNVVCLAQQELALWKSQPNYNSPYPQFTYAQTGFLKYSEQNYEEWCADFSSWIYKQAGYPLKGDYDGWRISYVPNIQAEPQNDPNFHWHPASSGYVPKPGDLAIHTVSTSANADTADNTRVGRLDMLVLRVSRTCFCPRWRPSRQEAARQRASRVSCDPAGADVGPSAHATVPPPASGRRHRSGKPAYSVRSASIGSMRVARTAGPNAATRASARRTAADAT